MISFCLLCRQLDGNGDGEPGVLMTAQTITSESLCTTTTTHITKVQTNTNTPHPPLVVQCITSSPNCFMLYNYNTQVCANNTFSLLRIILLLLSHILSWLIVYMGIGCHGNCACSMMVFPSSSCTFCSVFKCWPKLHSSVISVFFVRLSRYLWWVLSKLLTSLLYIYLQTLKGGLSETRIEKRIVITGDCDIDHDEVSFPERLPWPSYLCQQLVGRVPLFWVMLKALQVSFCRCVIEVHRSKLLHITHYCSSLKTLQEMKLQNHQLQLTLI